MKQACTLIALCLSSLANAQLVNGSFENEEGWDLTGWVSSCGNAFFGIGHPDHGNWSTSVPHGETNGSCYASHIVQFVPAIQDGSTWTLDGWLHNMLTGFSDPYIGMGMGIKHEDGWWEYFTSAQMNTGNWTHLTVTNSFTIAQGDTAFVILDGGLVSGNGSPAWAEFDGMVLTDLSTGIAPSDADAPACFPNPAHDRLWVDTPERPQSTTVIDATGREHPIATFHHNRGSLEADVSSIPPGPCVMLLKSGTGVRMVRFIKA